MHQGPGVSTNHQCTPHGPLENRASLVGHLGKEEDASLGTQVRGPAEVLLFGEERAGICQFACSPAGSYLRLGATSRPGEELLVLPALLLWGGVLGEHAGGGQRWALLTGLGLARCSIPSVKLTLGHLNPEVQPWDHFLPRLRDGH